MNEKNEGATPDVEASPHSGECMSRYAHKWQWVDMSRSNEVVCSTCGVKRVPDALKKKS